MSCLSIGENGCLNESPHKSSSSTMKYPEPNSSPIASPQGLDYDDYGFSSPKGPCSLGHPKLGILKDLPADLHNIDSSNYEHRSTSWTAIRPGIVGQERTDTPFPRGHVGTLDHQHQLQAYGRSSTHHYNDYTAGHHNTVEVGRIRQGLDVRTTVRT